VNTGYRRSLSKPVNRTAANAGEIGYVPVFVDGADRGYTITGDGPEDGTIIHRFAKELCMHMTSR
jgi:hypothetical protein